MRIRTEVEILAKDARNYDNCDEGAWRKHARSQMVYLHMNAGPPPTNGGLGAVERVPALHLSWRQPVDLLELNDDECKLLIMSGLNVKTGEEYPYVSTLERKYRHRYLAFYKNGWCLSTSDKGGNLAELAPCMHTMIPTIALTPREELLIGVHDAYRTLKEDLKIHGVLPEFMKQQEIIFQALAEVAAKAVLLKKIPDPQAVEVPMGRVSVGG